MRPFSLFSAVVLAAALLSPNPTGASLSNGPGPEEVRLGISFGGISFTGFIMEYRWGDRSVEINIGTWSFRDLSVSLVGKQYFGPGDFRPFAGLGLWAVLAPHGGSEEKTGPGGSKEQTGLALMARAPIGVEWNADADHHLGAHLSLNRALWIRRKDPLDDYPPTNRLIPLPGFYYLWKR